MEFNAADFDAEPPAEQSSKLCVLYILLLTAVYCNKTAEVRITFAFRSVIRERVYRPDPFSFIVCPNDVTIIDVFLSAARSGTSASGAVDNDHPATNRCKYNSFINLCVYNCFFFIRTSLLRLKVSI